MFGRTQRSKPPHIVPISQAFTSGCGLPLLRFDAQYGFGLMAGCGRKRFERHKSEEVSTAPCRQSVVDADHRPSDDVDGASSSLGFVLEGDAKSIGHSFPVTLRGSPTSGASVPRVVR